MRLPSPSPFAVRSVAVGATVAAGLLLSTGCEALSDMGMPGASGSPQPSGVPSSSPEVERFAMPVSCADVGAAEIVGRQAPNGAVLDEQAGAVDGIEDTEQLACTWGGTEAGGDTGADSGTGPGSGTGTGTGTADGGASTAPGGADAPGAEPSFSLVFTTGTDPSDRAEVVQLPGAEQEMNWEVDVDVDIDSYRTGKTDDLGGELKYVTTIDGSSKQLYLSLPGDFHVAAVALYSKVKKADLERVVIAAARKSEK